MRMLHGRLAGVRKTAALAERRLAARPTRRRIAYIGGEGHGNLGDDAMFEAAQRLFREAALLSLDHPVRERRLAHVNLAGRRYFHAAVLGGGTLINPIWFDQVRCAIEQKLPVWTLGTGVGSCGFVQPREVEIASWVPLLSRFRRLGVRGPRSKQALDAQGIEGADVVGDLALALTLETASRPADPARFAVNVYLPWADRRQPDRYPSLQSLKRVLQDLVRAGWQTVPVAMSREDLPTLSWLMDEVNGMDQPLSCAESTESLFESVRRCSFSIAVRLHAAVLSCCVGVPPLMLGYRDKCLDFMESMGLEDWYVDLETSEPETVAAKVKQLVETGPVLRESVLAQAQHWKRRIQAYASSTRAFLSE